MDKDAELSQLRLSGRAVDTVAAADQLALAVHRGQRDKSGRPYVAHPRAVARLVAEGGGTTDQQMAALLHDVVEDGGISLEQLAAFGVRPAVVTVVDAVTRRPTEAHGRYLTRLRRNPDAVVVKRADIIHNSQPERLDTLDRAIADRLRRKYATAAAILAGEPCYLIEHHDRPPTQPDTHVPYRALWRVVEDHEWEYLSIIDWSWHRAPEAGRPQLPPLDRLSPTSHSYAHGLAAATQLWIAWYATSWSPSDQRPVGVVRRRISPERTVDEAFTTHLTWEPTGIIHETETATSSSRLHLRPIDHAMAERLLHKLCDVQDATSLGLRPVHQHHLTIVEAPRAR